MKNYSRFKLCEELQFILDEEIKVENVLLELPLRTNWPLEGSIFVSLTNRLTAGKKVLTDDVYYLLIMIFIMVGLMNVYAKFTIIYWLQVT